jgi:DNA-binding transcriptional ArsR family regulator
MQSRRLPLSPKIIVSTFSACLFRRGRKACRRAESPPLDLAPNTLTFHFDRLRAAGLVTVRRASEGLVL